MIRIQCCMQNIYSYSNTQIRVRIYMGLEVAVLMPLIYLNQFHYSDVRMGSMASQTTSLTIVYTTIYSGADQRKHQSSAPLAFVRGIHRGPMNSPHKWPVTRKMFPFDYVIMYCKPSHFCGHDDSQWGLPYAARHLRRDFVKTPLPLIIFSHGRPTDLSRLAFLGGHLDPIVHNGCDFKNPNVTGIILQLKFALDTRISLLWLEVCC